MRPRKAPNRAFDRTAGSHPLAAAGQRGRWADQRPTHRDVVSEVTGHPCKSGRLLRLVDNLWNIRLSCPARAFWRTAIGANRPAVVVAKGQAARLAYISEEIKASGFVQQAITRSGWRGVQVAPAASPTAQK